MSPDEFKMQNRGGIGVAGMTTKDDDEVSILTLSRTKRDVLFFTSVGKVYRVRGYQIPEGSRTSKGIPVINFLSLAKDERVLEILSVDAHDQKYLVFVTESKNTNTSTKLERLHSMFVKVMSCSVSKLLMDQQRF